MAISGKIGRAILLEILYEQLLPFQSLNKVVLDFIFQTTKFFTIIEYCGFPIASKPDSFFHFNWPLISNTVADGYAP
jgi:hypothetical protein